MKPLVITSINPKSNLEHQRRCFNAWRALGYEVLTYNSAKECTDLIGHGFPPGAIVRLPKEHTAEGVHGFPSPRIVPVLRDAHGRGAEGVVLVNADIYPAIRKNAGAFAEFGNCAALTRNEVAALEVDPAVAGSPYRGGLDIFYFSREALGDLLPLLAAQPVAERMAFGVPGWDFYLGGHVISPALGGRFFDAGYLLHVSHPTTYSNVQEFEHYVPSLRQAGHVASADANGAAREFANLIHQQCEAHRTVAATMFLAYFDHNMERRRLATASTVPAHCVATVQRMNREMLPSQVLDPVEVAATATAANPFTALKVLTSRNAVVQTRFVCGLRALYLALTLFPKSNRFPAKITSRYPRGNMHGKAIEGIKAVSDPEVSRHAVLSLFGNELVLYGIFNKQVLQYICLSCTSDEERKLVSKICKLIRELNK